MKPREEMDDVTRAYRAAGGDAVPPPALDDAIRAAARRAVQARPQPVGQGWIGRWRTPLSAAAVMVLAVSVVFVAIEEQPEVVPPVLREATIARPAPSVAPPEEKSAVAAVERSLVAEQPTAASPRKAAPPAATSAPAPREQVADLSSRAGAAADSVAPRANPSPEEARARQTEVQAREKAAAGATAARSDAPAMTAQVAPTPVPAPPAPAFVPLPVPAATPVAPAPAPMARPAPAAPPSPVVSANLAEAFARQESAPAAGVAAAKRPVKEEGAMRDAAPTPPPVAVGAAASAPATGMAPPATMRKSVVESKEGADAWIKRMEQLLKDGKLKETREELVRFRKAYPQAVLPPDLARLPVE